MQNNQLYIPMAQQAQSKAFTATAASSAALPQYCEAVDLIANQDCRIEFLTESATEGTADATGSSGESLSAFIKAGIVYRYGVPKGAAATKISVVRVSADGTLQITPLSRG